MSASTHRRPVPARVEAALGRRRSNAAVPHVARPDREVSRKGCRGNGLRAAIAEQIG